MVGIIHKSKVGPKGQVLIPKMFRDNMKIFPGSDVVLSFEDDAVVIKRNATGKIEEIAEKIAKKGKSNKMTPKEMRHMEITERWAKIETWKKHI